MEKTFKHSSTKFLRHRAKTPRSQRLALVFFRRNHRKQQVRGLVSAGVDCIVGAEVIVRLVVGVGRAADAVTRLDVEAEPVSLPENDGGGPDLDLALHRLTGLEPPPRVVRMVRAVRPRARGVELAVRGAEPSFC